jgi:F0F1-type ATP synthase membrane subunit c/vacuolar-type H+-ATPase subunit K
VPLGFVFGAAVLWLAEPTPASLAAGIAIALPGEALRIWAAGHLNKSREITSSGPYRWFAHPLYVGSSLLGAALAVASANVIVALLIAVYLATTLTAAIRSEEAFLRRTFATEYAHYRQAPASNRLDRDRRFSAARAVANREHRTVAGLVVVLLLLVLKATYNGSFWRAAAGR